jgi:CheY-like chemotaxis protein
MIEILLVDHDPRDVLLVKECLGRQYPVAVTVAEDAEQGLRLLASPGYRPNLVLLELSIPRLDGYDVLRRIRRGNPALPIVVLNASTSQEDISRAYASGANMYAETPSDPDRFRKMVHAIARMWVVPLTGARAACAG